MVEAVQVGAHLRRPCPASPSCPTPLRDCAALAQSSRGHGCHAPSARGLSVGPVAPAPYSRRVPGLEIRPFEEGDLDAAAVLLAARHAAHRRAEPLLSPRFESPETARAELVSVWL